MNEIIASIISSLDDSLLKKEYLSIKNKNKYTGHCYVATEALYYLLPDTDRINYTPAILKVNGKTHWFLKNKTNLEIIDITKEQFDFKLDYTNARNCFFLTKEPSNRTKILISRINEKNCY